MLSLTHSEAEALILTCNGCGEPMRFMGEWPVQWPKADHTMNIHQAYRWACPTCRTPHPRTPNGLPVLIAIIGINPIQAPTSAA